MVPASARRVAFGTLIASAPLPRPTALDLGFQGEAQERSDQDDDRQQPDAGEGQRGGDGADDVGTDQEFQAKRIPGLGWPGSDRSRLASRGAERRPSGRCP